LWNSHKQANNKSSDAGGIVITGTSESQTLAATNGCIMENIIKNLYPNAQFEYTGLIDLTIDGKRVEIKSCQDRVRDSSTSTGRWGRFHFREEQHSTLIENEGDYIFLVHHEGTPFIYLRIPARDIKLSKFKEEKALCWKSVIREALA
jgi:hypothetical protein